MGRWEKECQKKGPLNYYPHDFRRFRLRWSLRQATVHETMGPNWKKIVWSPNARPHVVLGRRGGK